MLELNLLFSKNIYLKSIIPDTCYFATYQIIEAVVQRCSVKKVVCKKGVLKNLPKFTGKHLCQSLF